MLASPCYWKSRNAANWQQLQADAVPRLDSSGNPVLQVKLGDKTVDIGLSRSNILRISAPPELATSCTRPAQEN